MGSVAPHTTPVRAHQASLGTICAASWRVGAGSLVPRGPHGSRRLGRGGGSRSGSSLGQGGTIPPASGGGGWRPRGLRAGGGAGGGCRAAASLLPFWAAACGTQSWPPSCRRRAPSWRARAVGAEVPPRGGGGVRGGPWTAPPGGLADLNPPSALPEWAVVTGGSCGARPPYCSVVSVAQARQCGLAEAGPAAAPPTASPPRLRGGRGPRLWLPSWGRGGGGGGGAAPPPALWPEWEGGGVWGGASGPLATPPDGRGGGGMAVPAPGASLPLGGRALPPPPST